MRLGAALAGLGLILAACSNGSEIRLADSIPDDCNPPHALRDEPDHILLAHEILSETSTDLILDENALNDLAAEIEAVLGGVRAELPKAQFIHPPATSRWQVWMQVQGALADQLQIMAQAWHNRMYITSTGDTEFDALNRRVGTELIEVHVIGEHVYVSLCLGPLANAQQVAQAHDALSSVAYAEEGGFLTGHSPSLDLRERDGTWFVVVNDARDCGPAGCVGVTLHFFSVSGGRVTRVSEETARYEPLFHKLVPLVQPGNTQWRG